MKIFVRILLIVCTGLLTIQLQANSKYSTEKEPISFTPKANTQTGFVPNNGQLTNHKGEAVPDVYFAFSTHDLNMWICKTGLVCQVKKYTEEPKNDTKTGENTEDNISVTWERFDIDLLNANIKKENIITENPNDVEFNYYYAHCPNGILNVKSYRKITISDVYPGIDWVIYFDEGSNLKYDFIVHPGADYKDIQLLYKTKNPVNIDNGQLVIHTDIFDVHDNEPVSFLQSDTIDTKYTIHQQSEANIYGESGYETIVGFQCDIEDVNINDDLIIDPALYWCTAYGGGSWDYAFGVCTDASNNIYVVGLTYSDPFPLQALGGAFNQAAYGGVKDGLIQKYSSTGMLLWCTYYGGTGGEKFYRVKCDASDNIYIVGETTASDFPVWDDGTAYHQAALSGGDEGVILKFDNTGARVFATYFGGDNSDVISGLVLDNNNHFYIVGESNSSAAFPVFNRAGAYNDVNAAVTDPFLAMFNLDGTQVWATYLGGDFNDRAYAVAVDAADNVFVAGYIDVNNTNFPFVDNGTYYVTTMSSTIDAFIMKFNSAGAMVWSTLFGGTSHEYGYQLEVNPLTQDVYMYGLTYSTDLPVTNSGGFYDPTYVNNTGPGDGYIARFSNDGALQWCTYLGGDDNEYFPGLNSTWQQTAVDACGNFYCALSTYSTDIPTMNSCDNATGGYDDNSINGAEDQYFAVFDQTDNMVWGTYFGGDGVDPKGAVCIDSEGNLILAGMFTMTTPATYPLTDPGGGAYFDNTANGSYDLSIAKFTAASCLCQILPVEMVSFTAYPQTDYNLVRWVTASETNSDYFILERSIITENGTTDWETVQIINGAGNSNETNTYTFKDYNVNDFAKGYYRLKQIDYDGKYAYYGPVSIDRSNTDNEIEVNIYPNPASNNVNIEFLNPSEDPNNIFIYNVAGQMVYEKQVINSESVINETINTENWERGCYYIMIRNSTNLLETKKLILQ
ncbi:MAG: hypothetical protein C0592_14100 [Marinilabiliales bacterium]|nr:MAG: hypothetical protein C0592_14100 [Marinilabiliales bacterium]